MILKSCSNKLNPFVNLMGFTFKKNLGFTAVATIVALLFSPGLIWNVARQSLEYEPIYDLMLEFDFFAGAMAIACMAFCALLLIINFSYLYNKKGTDAYHALPLTRIELFAARFIPAFVCSLVPLIAAYSGYMGISALPGIYADCSYILPALFFTIVMILFLSLFIMVFVLSAGAVFDAIVSVAAVNIGIPIIILFIEEECNTLLFGYSNMIGYEMFVYGTPFGFALYNLIKYCTYYDEAGRSILPLTQTIFVVLIIVALAALCLWLYNKRPSEKAGEAYAFAYMPALISVILGFIGYFALGAIFSGGETGSIVFFVMGIVGAVLITVIYSAITNRGFKKLKSALITAAVAIACVVVVNVCIGIDIFGYGSYIPNTSEILSANVNVVEYTTAVSREDIEKVVDLHREIVKNKDTATDSDNLNYAKITYNLKSGRTVERSYFIRSDIGVKEKQIITKDLVAPSIMRNFKDSKQKEFVCEGYYGENDEYYGSIRITREQAQNLMKLYTDYLKNVDEKYFDGYEHNLYIYSGHEEDDFWAGLYYNDDAKKLCSTIKQIFEKNAEAQTEK